jgi:hypothetical protein
MCPQTTTYVNTCYCLRALVACSCVGSALLHVSPYYYYICPHATSICVLTLVYVRACSARLCRQSTTLCPLILLLYESSYYYMSPYYYYICVPILLLYMCAHTTRCVGGGVSDVRRGLDGRLSLLLCMPYVCPQATTIYVSSY